MCKQKNHALCLSAQAHISLFYAHTHKTHTHTKHTAFFKLVQAKTLASSKEKLQFYFYVLLLPVGSSKFAY